MDKSNIKSNNPLFSIFINDSKDKITSEINSVENIEKFFIFLKDENINNENKALVINQLSQTIQDNRYISEYFSSYNNKSIYLYLFDLYFNSDDPKNELKKSIIDLLNVLKINISAGKDIYEYIFQKISLLYRGEIDINPNTLNNYLELLFNLLSYTENIQKPKNYFACSGKGSFLFNYDFINDKGKNQIKIGYSFSIMINFKLSKSRSTKMNILERTSKLIQITFSNNESINVLYEYPCYITVKEIKKKKKIEIPKDEWINLFMIVVCSNDILNLLLIVNGESIDDTDELLSYEIASNTIFKPNDKIVAIQFFENFFGEVGSFLLFSQKEKTAGGPLVNNPKFINNLKNYKEGLYKSKKIDNFVNMLKEIDENDNSKNISDNNNNNKNNNNNNSGLTLFESLEFIFSPINCYFTSDNVIEDYFGKYKMIYNGNIRNHRYLCYQKKLELVGGLINFYPITEMFLIHPKLLNEDNFEVLLKIIVNILNFGKENLKSFKESKFFKTFSLFLEKYPKNLFTEKILDAFFNIGKTLLGNNVESLCSKYFKQILLNEKILSKYDENLQVIFWNNMFKYCISDKYQIESLINMNRICLILRFYDKNKYFEMCCEEHLNMFKEEFVGNKKIMNPTMKKRLSVIQDIMDLIIEAQEPNNAFSLFKLLTLDLSPCLTKFIINIFIKVFKKSEKNEWLSNLVNVFLSNNYEIIITNTFIHSLPDVRQDIVVLIYQIYEKCRNNKSFKLEQMIKTCLLPQKMFYAKKEEIQYNNEEYNYLEESIKNIKSESNQDNINTKIISDKRKSSTTLLIQKENKKIQNILDNSNNNTSKSNNLGNENNNLIDIIKEETNKNENKDYLKKEEENLNDEKNKIFIRQTIENPKFIKKDNKNDNANKISTQNDKLNEQKEILIIKDELYKDYIDNLFTKFMKWSLGIMNDNNVNSNDFDKYEIKFINGLEILFHLNSELKNYDFTLKYIKTLLGLVEKQKINSCKLLQNKIIISSILNIIFNNRHHEKDKNKEKCFKEGKLLLFSIVSNSLIYIKNINSNDNNYILLVGELETLFLWGNKIISKDEILQTKASIFEFLYILLQEYLAVFKGIVGDIINFENNEKNIVVENNYFLKNYLMLVTYLFQYSFFYKNDSIINNNGLSALFISSQKEIDLPFFFVSSMRANYNSGNSQISKYWLDYKFFHDLYYKINYIWKKENIYKQENKGKDNKKSKLQKYENILQNIILKKEKDNKNKNEYQKQLEFLCYEHTKEENGIKITTIFPLIQIISISLMSLLSLTNNLGDNENFSKWLKDFKYFIKYLIISSCYLARANQEELYNYIQDKCLDVLAASICFLKNISNSHNCQCKEKIIKILKSLFTFCIVIINYQINYNAKHKIDKLGKKLFTKKASKNDLSECAIYILFNEYIKDKNGLPLISKKMELKENNVDKIIEEILTSEDWKNGLFMNRKLKEKLFQKFYSLNGYDNTVKSRFITLQKLNALNNLDDSYKNTILDLLPLYEHELMKYSNNSLEKNIKKRNQYKTFKKHCFSWRGLWSNKKKFFENISELKMKLTNHYTKTFMKPLLVPILDIDYYLPAFSNFNPKNIFKLKQENEKKNTFKFCMDIDKILKLSEQNQLVMDNIKKTFGENQTNIKYNYLRKIYLKSNKDLYDNLLRISNNLDFGKEEEFALLNNHNKTVKSKTYYLGCLVKTSHHIKGVFFIDDNQLNFKVFLNQKSGNSMSGVEKGFSNLDDDYDQDRQTCFGSYFVFHPKDKDLYKISIKYNDIKYILKRKYYYKNSGLEIYTNTNKSFYFNFKYEKECETAINDIIGKFKNFKQIIDDLKDQKDSSSNNVIGYQNNTLKAKKKSKDNKLKLSKIVLKWKNWKITNFEFLMWLNIFGNRSYNDISQYPVFPWILSKYTDPLKIEQKIKVNRSPINIITNIANITNKINISNSPNVTNTSNNLNIPNNANNVNSASNQNNINTSSDSINDENGTKDNKDNKETYEEVIDYKYRDLSLPMGMLELNEESIKRKNEFLELYSTLKSDEGYGNITEDINDEDDQDVAKPYIYGSNYSNPFYVCNFLTRIFPFTHISIELQGTGFDKPDRIFLSVANTFYLSTTQKTDVRELIPEFYYLPEMFLNINKLNMGIQDNGNEVNDIITPCQNNPYDFIMIMKTVLESDKISYSINNWIDLIFGSKSRGKEAENANNIFTEQSYQESVDISKKKNKGAFLRQVEFGLIPKQIMNKNCPKREKKENIIKGRQITDPSSDLKIFKCKAHNIKKTNYILKIGINGERINILNNSNVFVDAKVSWQVFEKKYTEEIVNNYKIGKLYNKIYNYQYPKKYNDKNIVFCNHKKIIIMGEFYDGKVSIISYEPKVVVKELIPFSEEIPIISITVNKNEEYLFLGDILGNIKIYKINDDIEKYESLHLISDQFSPISHLDCNEELNLWASASIDGYINIYTFPLCKLIRSIKVPINKCNYAFLSPFPSPSIIVIGEEEEKNESEIFVYSINGHLIMKQKEQSLITCPLIIKDINSYEYLAYITKDNIIIRNLPSLYLHVNIDNLKDIYAFCLSEDMRIIYGINQNGDEIYVIREETNNMLKNLLLMNKNNANNNSS